MANKRASNKVQIGAYIDLATDAGIKEWLKSHKRHTKTDFLFEAIVEKLQRDEIPVLPEAGNRQRPPRSQVVFKTSPHIMNDASSATASDAAGLLDAAAEAEPGPAPKHKPKP